MVSNAVGCVMMSNTSTRDEARCFIHMSKGVDGT